ncbi:MAG: lysine exporter LysO family protein [Candidatus Mcinerneyibacterium aminivorans]|jgi:uncharacterized membrane protein YbjE (DUF340 family)|uniref:Lysine exporter LysO family protein n=1 Tax=Candidatus Mcinerneyibacterium aminivorans TaxID=2703815 RepID=A0A5D0MFQ0_9BACT|nr:MAG: lysine exporter LysO family protein [Candidatus Mcinerneyibacterium aminivorans]
MKNSIGITAVFVVGIFLGKMKFLPASLLENDYTLYALYFLLFFIGVVLGSNKKALSIIKKLNWRIIIVPAGTIIGTFIGILIVSLFINKLELKELMAVGAGFGYYSLSSVFISKLHGSFLGTIALVSNLLREIITLLFTPLFVKIFGNLSSIMSGGATSMDSTLPVIVKYSGKDYGVIAIFNGLVLTILVPLLVNFILKVL